MKWTDRCRDAGPREPHHDLGARRADQLILRLLRGPIDDVDGIDLNYAVAFSNTSCLSRSVREDFADDDLTLLRLDLHTDAAIATASIGRERFELLRSEQLAVRIVELLHQAPRCFLVELASIERVDVALVHELENLIEQRLTATHDA